MLSTSSAETFFVSDTIEIVPYGTTIYDLCERLWGNAGNDNSGELDLLLTLRERERDEEQRKILSDTYTDIILVFDPQDNRYSPQKLDKLMQFFYESTEKGRLYINYPMVEANLHLGKNDQIKDFLDRTCFLDELHGHTYKSRVSQEGIQVRMDSLNQDLLVDIIRHQQIKLNYILNGSTDFELTIVQQENLLKLSEYLKTIESIKQDIKVAQYKAVLSVNSTLILLYYPIGQVINEYKSWGNKFVDNLSRDIKLEFPAAKGYSVRNLKYMAKLATVFPDVVIVQEVLAQLP